MDLNLSQDELRFRNELRSWLAANAPKDWNEHRDEPLETRFDFLKRWQRKLYDGGWMCIHWPKEYGGRGATLLQQLIYKHLTQAVVVSYPSASLNFLNTQIALVEAGEGFAVIPSFGLPACRNRRVVVSRLVNPVVSLDFYQIINRAKKLPLGAEEFMSFLQNYSARWAGRAGIL